MKTLFPKTAVATALVTLLFGSAVAQAAAVLPPVHKSGAVEYLSGGIGQDEAKAVERASSHWPLALEFAVKDKKHADFAANVKVAVRDAKGHTELQAMADGPFLLAKLPAGSYSVSATLAGKTLHENVLVKQGQHAKAVFVWPAGTGETNS
jgi:hypothetical protein